MSINASLDGIEHINIYSKGKTSLGKNLSNFAHTPFVHPEYGEFQSVEGFWFWLKCFLFNQSDFPELKTLHGFLAKKRGSELFLPLELTDEEYSFFKSKIIEVLKIKLKSHRNILNELIRTSLPLKHYYVFNEGKPNEFAKDLPEYQWIVDTFEEVRTISINFLKEKGRDSF